VFSDKAALTLFLPFGLEIDRSVNNTLKAAGSHCHHQCVTC
jgi:hypothetical protein